MTDIDEMKYDKQSNIVFNSFWLAVLDQYQLFFIELAR